MNTLTQRPGTVLAYVAGGELDNEPVEVRASYRAGNISISTGLASLDISAEAVPELIAHLQAALEHLLPAMEQHARQGGEA